MQKVAMRLRDLIGSVDLIVTSPYVRARQTAEILGQIFFDTEIAVAAELVPQGPPVAFARWLQAHGRDVKSVMVVGHDPQLSVFGTYLLAGRDESFLEMKKSGVACLQAGNATEIGASCARLRWLLPPKLWAD